MSFVIDVRSIPYSRHQPEFSQEPLKRLLAANSMKYVFMGQLLGGRPDDSECYSDGKVDYAKCRTRPFFREGIDRLVRAYTKGLRICLLCSEGKPWECHRSKLIGAELEALGVQVVHILPDGSVRTQSEVITILTGGQSSLFEECFHSRKSYE